MEKKNANRVTYQDWLPHKDFEFNLLQHLLSKG